MERPIDVEVPRLPSGCWKVSVELRDNLSRGELGHRLPSVRDPTKPARIASRHTHTICGTLAWWESVSQSYWVTSSAPTMFAACQIASSPVRRCERQPRLSGQRCCRDGAISAQLTSSGA